MSKLAKILWLVSGLSLMALLTIRYILGGWETDWMYLPLGLFVICFFVALVVAYKFYFEFLTLKTTKHGMNMGVLILLVMALLVSVNFFGKKYSQSWDLTDFGLHSLSDQSKTQLKNLEDNISFIGFYRGEEDSQQKDMVKNAFFPYEQYSTKVKLRLVNAYVENQLAEQYLSNIQDKNKLVLFAEYKGKRVRVMEPFDEQNITSAIIKVSRDSNKTIYFLVGHGERDMNSDEAEGVSLFKQRLEESSYIVKELSLISAQVIPTDADIVAIIGPTLQILEGERNLIKDYLLKGGRLFIAADPGEKHQVALLTKMFGIEYYNNFVLDVGMNRLMGRGVAGILGLVFDEQNEITKKFIGQRGFTLFDKVSSLGKDPNISEDIKLTELVSSPQSSFTVNELKNIKPPKTQDSYPLAIIAEGKLKNEKDESGEEFAALVFGDSDFLTQKDIINGFNIDLAMNSISYLAKQEDLISIAAKKPKGTTLQLTSTKFNIMVVLGALVPLVFLTFSGIIWFRRRNA